LQFFREHPNGYSGNLETFLWRGELTTSGSFLILSYCYPDVTQRNIRGSRSTLAWRSGRSTAKRHTFSPPSTVTNATTSTRKLVEEYPPGDFGYSLQILAEHEHFVTVDLA